MIKKKKEAEFAAEKTQDVGLQTVSLCKSMIMQLLTFPDVLSLQVLHINFPALVRHQ